MDAGFRTFPAWKVCPLPLIMELPLRIRDAIVAGNVLPLPSLATKYDLQLEPRKS